MFVVVGVLVAFAAVVLVLVDLQASGCQRGPPHH